MQYNDKNERLKYKNITHT